MRRAITSKPAGRRATVAIVVLLAALAPGSGTKAAPGEGNVFTVGNYPVEARAADAVAAKDRAIQDGQQAAFRSLLKRLVPVTAYSRLKTIKTRPAAGLIEGFRVRSERNSSTEYIASYDFAFLAEGVVRLLEAEGIPYVDKQAPRIVVVPVYRAGGQPPSVLAEAVDTWTYAWRGLDLDNTLTPIRLAEAKRELHADTIAGALKGDGATHRILAGEYQTSLVVLAVLEPSADGKRATVTLSGQDSVGPLFLQRKYRLDGDLAYASELAAVISLGVIEGRWKSANGHLATARVSKAALPGAALDGPGTAGPPAPAGSLIEVSVAFQGMSEWQQISSRLSATPGVSDIDVRGLSSRGARMALSYPGGGDALQRALQAQGLQLRQAPTGGWVLTMR